MRPTPPITTKNLAQLAWAAGFRGVAGLARAIGRQRETLYQAVSNPQRYGPTIDAIRQALGFK